MRAIGWVALLLVGCTDPLTNDEIIAETHKCEAAGLDAVTMSKWASGDLAFRVECRPKGQTEVAVDL